MANPIGSMASQLMRDMANKELVAMNGNPWHETPSHYDPVGNYVGPPKPMPKSSAQMRTKASPPMRSLDEIFEEQPSRLPPVPHPSSKWLGYPQALRAPQSAKKPIRRGRSK